jgi:hypothetical protein
MMALWAETGTASVCVGCDCTTDKSKIYFCMYIPTGMSNIKIIFDLLYVIFVVRLDNKFKANWRVW